jgi:hypothetical protein
MGLSTSAERQTARATRFLPLPEYPERERFTSNHSTDR